MVNINPVLNLIKTRYILYCQLMDFMVTCKYVIHYCLNSIEDMSFLRMSVAI